MSASVAMITISFYPSIGGAQTHTLRLSKALRARGIDVFVVTRMLPGLAAYEEVEGVPTYRVGDETRGKVGAALSFIGGALGVLRRRRDLAIVHCHQMISPMTIGMAARLALGARLLVNPHGGGPRGDVGLLTRRRRGTGRLRIVVASLLADAFIGISRDIRGELLSVGVPEGRIVLIPNGVDARQFSPAGAGEREALRRELGLPDAPLVVFSGRMVAAKAIDVLLNAWPIALQRVPEARLLLVGDGELRPQLERQAATLQIADSVIFAGSTSNPVPYLRASDLFVLSSRSEGMPVALLEAMACGLPSVATSVGGSSELIEDGASGRLVPPEDPAALGAAIGEVLCRPALMGARARQRIVEQYSLDQIAGRYAALYNRILRHNDPLRASKSL